MRRINCVFMLRHACVRIVIACGINVKLLQSQIRRRSAIETQNSYNVLCPSRVFEDEVKAAGQTRSEIILFELITIKK